MKPARMSGDDITIRVADQADADAIAAIYAPIVRETAISFETEPPSADDMADRVEATLPSHPWLVALRAGKVVGYAYAGQHQQRAAYRWSANVTAYIDAAERRAGVGTRLYGVLIPVLRAQGFRSAFAGITLPNDASKGLHEAVGFKALGVYEDVGFKLGAWRDVGWWRLALSESAAAPAEPAPFARFRLTPGFSSILG
jgi:L-amino acid N-acyltransferase YncA